MVVPRWFGVFDTGPERLSMGSTFTMSMRLFGVPYRVTNRVAEFEPNQLIAWRHFEPQHWRYELKPVADGTEKTASFDRLLLLARVRPMVHQAPQLARTQPAHDRSDPAAPEG